MSFQNSHQISEVKVLLKKGADGSGIANIELTGQALNVDTYTITLTNGDKYTFDVTNGTSIASIEKTSTVGNVDTYTITLTDGSTFTFTVTNAYGASASDIDYDNTTSGLSATKVQGAIDELSEADNIKFDNSGTGLSATKVQGAITEVLEKTKHGWYEVWTNDSHNNFAGQTIHITTDKIFDVFMYAAGDASTYTIRGLSTGESNGSSVVASMSLSGNGDIRQYTRVYTASKTSTGYDIAITDNTISYRGNNGAVSSSTDNSFLVPVRIYGIVHND